MEDCGGDTDTAIAGDVGDTNSNPFGASEETSDKSLIPT